MNDVYLNGEFVPGDRAQISVFDQGLLYGDGIFESFRSIGDRLYQFDQHYARLLQSAEALNYAIPYSQQELEDILLELRQRNQLENAYYRITITRGRGEIGFQRNISNDLTCLVMGREFQGFAAEYYQQGIELRVAQTRRNAPEAINPKIKSISNLNSLLGKLEAKAAGAFEVIMLNNKEHICEGASSNIFWVKDKWIFTPDASTGLLEGVTRATIIRLCEEKLNLRVIAGEFKLQDLKFSDEVFITSTSLEVMPVIKVDDFIINQGQVGRIAYQLRKELHLDMEQKSEPLR
ncbi:branched-chain amino acid aminotransferase [Malonomonas rubra DSM 5091]|uniref:branched-chain-amino-acid transaminase n=1 Tax=Malonomonas rubra DSM 5091 TaxID=1122189 RepID=A0A1M6IIT5_MALRU|nr:aminotransferase class IV [Malonomonas rubra]SHJ34293.1 branched-chain amino acid aminotransferase [Malonomonas rubra DSM 5091]